MFSIVNTAVLTVSLGDFANPEGAQTYITEVLALVDPEGVRKGAYQVIDIGEPAGSMLTISLDIENAYELYVDVNTRVVDAMIPVPPQDESRGAYQDWEEQFIIAWSGVGHDDGDSWYDLEVAACSDLTLIGKTYSFGY